MRAFESEENDLKYPDWQEPLREAVLEVDKDKLKVKLFAAETAIFKRQQSIVEQQLIIADDLFRRRQAISDEQQAIADALALIRVFKRDQLGFPDWEKK